MGGDGGVIAAKKQYMHGGGIEDQDEKNTSKKSVKDTQNLRTRTCPLSGETLVEPIVACELGHLYNKESILKCLLEKQIPPEFGHVQSQKDVKEVHFTESLGTSRDKDKCKWMCPLTGLELNGIVPFVMFWSNGKVISEKGFKEMGVDALQEEFGPFDSDDVVKLLPLESEVEKQRDQMMVRREMRHRKKKKRK